VGGLKEEAFADDDDDDAGAPPAAINTRPDKYSSGFNTSIISISQLPHVNSDPVPSLARLTVAICDSTVLASVFFSVTRLPAAPLDDIISTPSSYDLCFLAERLQYITV